jgi:hypothetical protein
MTSPGILPPIYRGTGRGRVPRAVWHSIGLLVALLLAYAIWRGYQSPDLLLDLASLRFC